MPRTRRSSSPGLRVLAFLIGAAAAALAIPNRDAQSTSALSRPGPRDEVVSSRLPLRFVENRGAWSDRVRFAVLGGPTPAWVGLDALTFRLDRWEGSRSRGAVVRLAFAPEGGGARAAVGEVALESRTHVIRAGGQAGAAGASFARVRLLEVWPGIDVVVREDPEAGEAGVIAYDLFVRPGADLSRARVTVEGVDAIESTPDGGLSLDVPLGDGTSVRLVQRPPVSWVEGDAGPIAMPSRLCRIDDRTFGFEVDGWNGADPLVVDPGFSWSTYLGGGGSDACKAVQVVPGSGVVIAGWAGSSDFPTTPGAYRETGARDAFVAMLAEDGARLLWSTYLGGSEAEEAEAIDVAADGTVVVGGWTGSQDFPVTPGVFQRFFWFGSPLFAIGDGFVLKLSADGSQLLWSTFLGRVGDDFVRAVHAEPDGSVIVGGDTTADMFPTTPGVLQPTFRSGSTLVPDIFIARLAPGGTALEWSTYFGGFAQDVLEGMCVAADGTIVIAGLTSSGDLPITGGAFQQTLRGNWDGFVARIAADGRSLVWSTFFGGEGPDHVRGLALDPLGDVLLVGRTSTDAGAFPVTADAFQLDYGTEEDGYVARLSGDGSTLVAATLVSGVGDDACEAVAVADDGSVLVAGYASDRAFPVGPDAAQPRYGGGIHDGFVARFDGSLSFARAVSFAGGSAKDQLVAIASLGGAEVVAAGTTHSADVPLDPPSIQPGSGGASDAIVVAAAFDADGSGGVRVTDLGATLADAVFTPGIPVVVVVARLANEAAGALDVSAVDVVLGGAASSGCISSLSLFRDLDGDGQLGSGEPRLAGPMPLGGDETRVRIPVGLQLAPAERIDLLVVAQTGPACPEGAEIVVGIDADHAVVARRAGDRRRAAVEGAEGLQGRTWIHSARRVFAGDLDGDGRATCRDVRRLAGRLGEVASGSGEDPDRDGIVTENDLEMLLALTVDRPAATLPLGASAASVRRSGLVTIEGYGLDGAGLSATLAGIPLRLALQNFRSASFVVPPGASAGLAALRVLHDGVLLLDAMVEVR